MKPSIHYARLKEMLKASQEFMETSPMEQGVQAVMLEDQAALAWALEKLKRFGKKDEGNASTA